MAMGSLTGGLSDSSTPHGFTGADLVIGAECGGSDACRRLVEAFLPAIVSTIDPRRPR
jgi:hypothetical protein